jgi:protein-S-isoprenylcysteine O-methyltransferase Ste14
MAFHMANHKPKVAGKRAAPLVKTRIQLVALGVLVLLVSMFVWSRGLPVPYDIRIAPVGAFFALGVLLIMLAAIPFSWIDRIAKRLDSRSTKANQRVTDRT